MRAIIREMLAEGRTREEILDFFVDRYGPDILAAPPKSGRNLLAWILPIVGVAIGLAGVFLVIRAMTNRERPASSRQSVSQRKDESTPGEPPDPELTPYLEIVDRMLASRRGARTAFSASAGPSQAFGPADEELSDQDILPGPERANDG